MSPPGGFDADALLLGYCAGELTQEEQDSLFRAAAANQDLFDQLMDAEAVRHALTFPEERRRAAEVVNAWEQEQPGKEEVAMAPARSAPRLESQLPQNYAALENRAPHRTHARLTDLLCSALYTVATTLLLRISYSLLTAVGSSLLAPGAYWGGVTMGAAAASCCRSCIWCRQSNT